MARPSVTHCNLLKAPRARARTHREAKPTLSWSSSSRTHARVPRVPVLTGLRPLSRSRIGMGLPVGLTGSSDMGHLSGSTSRDSTLIRLCRRLLWQGLVTCVLCPNPWPLEAGNIACLLHITIGLPLGLFRLCREPLCREPSVPFRIRTQLREGVPLTVCQDLVQVPHMLGPGRRHVRPCQAVV